MVILDSNGVVVVDTQVTDAQLRSAQTAQIPRAQVVLIAGALIDLSVGLRGLLTWSTLHLRITSVVRHKQHNTLSRHSQSHTLGR